MLDAITVKDAPAPLLEAARRVTEQGDRLTLDMGGKTVALVPVEDAEYMEALEDAKDVRLALEAMEESRRSGIGPIPHEDFMKELKRVEGMDPEEAEQAWTAFEERYRIRPAEMDAPERADTPELVEA